MVSTLAAHYDDTALFHILGALKKSPEAKGIATKLENELVQWSVAAGKSPTYVFKLFAPEKLTDELLQMPQFVSWLKYVDDFNIKRRGMDETVTSALLHRYNDDMVFKMLDTAKKKSSINAIATKLEKELYSTWISEKVSPRFVFKTLELDKAGRSVFSNPRFFTWMEYFNTYNKANPKDKDTMISAFYDSYSRASVARIIAPAMSEMDVRIVKITKQLQAERQDMWMHWKILPKEAFSRAGLDRAGASFLSDPNFKLWNKYLDAFNLRYPEAKTNVIYSLRSHYSDETLASFLAQARDNPTTEKIATNLQSSLLNTWARELKEPAEISKFLKSDDLMQTYVKKFNWALKDSGDKLFDTPDLTTWLKYVDFFKAKYPTKDMSTISILKNRYGEIPLARMIETSKSTHHTQDIAKQLSTDQFQNWMSEKRTPSNIFELLKLKYLKDNPLENPLFKTWSEYGYIYNRNHRAATENHIEILVNGYGNERLSNILIEAKNNVNLHREATSLQKRLWDRWLSAEVDPKNIYVWLHIEKAQPTSKERGLYDTYLQKYKMALKKKKVGSLI
ncbi:hypothetical protein PHMEG_00019168 [Phytophthora megakarya]|uniref:RxLR effector PexRD54 WY domain-containing protein n=1 Tax=Phytophthora megakarya TaxID=4795 RepID=A0A225VTQ4_9STRA|nr:hypothetical protein PHMEG_00019168 [Phytophthora megakarya]